MNDKKIIKHTFTIPKIRIEDGELIVAGETKETYTFTMLHRGVGVYEEMTGKSLVKEFLSKGNESDMMNTQLLDREFILNLAAASYVKIDGYKFHNNRATAEEFKKLPVANHIFDLAFIAKLYEMVGNCIITSDATNGLKQKAQKATKK